jgi:hypothetical protein
MRRKFVSVTRVGEGESIVGRLSLRRRSQVMTRVMADSPYRAG